MNVPALLASGAIVLAAAPAVLGHGYIVDPAAQWSAGYPVNGYPSTVDNDMFGTIDNSVYGYGVQATVDFFKAKYPDAGYDSLKAFILAEQVVETEGADPECGVTIHDPSKLSKMPSGSVQFSGFTHQGPCELWCDDNLLAFDYDCMTTYPDGKVPIDDAKCEGATKFSIYWIGLHGDPWQVYPDCVWLEGGSASDGSSSTNTTTTTAPATTTAAPAATTAAPATTTAAPAATTATPAADDEYDDESAAGESTPAPSTNCQRRMRK